MKMVGIKGTINWLIPEWASGIQKLGDEFHIKSLDQVPSDEDCYIHIGYISNKKNIYSQENYDGITFVHRSGRPYLVFEFSPFRQFADRYWKVGWTHYNHVDGDFNATPNDNSRWKKFSQDTGLVIKDWHSPGDSILIIGQLEYDSALNRMYAAGYETFYDWAFDTVDNIRRHTDRPIVIRPHPRNFVEKCKNPNVPFSMEDVHARCQLYKNVSISSNLSFVNYYKTKNGGDGLIEDLKNSHCVVTYSSSAAVEAVCMGIPIFSFDPGAPAYDISHHDLSQIENLDYDISIDTWCNTIACSVWSAEEIKNGDCWAHLKPVFFPDHPVQLSTTTTETQHKIFIINLAQHTHRKDRMLHIMKNSGISNYEFVKAIDGRTLPQSVIDSVYDKKSAVEVYQRDLACTEIGCALSHYNCYESIIKQDLDFGVIFEDDVELLPTFTASQLRIPANVDILLIGGRIREKKDPTTAEIIPLQHNADGAYAYVVSRNGARKLIEYHDKIRHVSDNWGAMLEVGIKIYYLSEMIVNVNREIDSYIALDRDAVRKIAYQKRKLDAPPKKIHKSRDCKPESRYPHIQDSVLAHRDGMKPANIMVHVFVDSKNQKYIEHLQSMKKSITNTLKIRAKINLWAWGDDIGKEIDSLPGDLFTVRKCQHFADAYTQAIAESNSRYLLMMPGFYEFQNVNHEIKDMLANMKQQRLLHMRFNTHSNTENHQDIWLESRSVDKFHYCLTPAIDDQMPHIINKKYFVSDILPFLEVDDQGKSINYRRVQFVDGAIYGSKNHPSSTKKLL
jgi:hypothetical protein